jgi:adenylate cyclase
MEHGSRKQSRARHGGGRNGSETPTSAPDPPYDKAVRGRRSVLMPDKGRSDRRCGGVIYVIGALTRFTVRRPARICRDRFDPRRVPASGRSRAHGVLRNTSGAAILNPSRHLRGHIGAVPKIGEGMVRAARKLVAVLAADVAGYSRMMEIAAESTHARLMQLEAETVHPGITKHFGRVIKRTGDGFLASFDSAQDALDCALSIQGAVAEAAMVEPSSSRMLYRMGLNIADVFLEQDDIYGDGVIIAARLQTYAEPGGLVISGAFYEQVGGRNGLTTVDLGELQLKNIGQPIRAYSLRPETAGPLPVSGAANGRPSIAVLPFRQVTRDAPDAYFVEGIIEGIIHVLAGLRDLFVISHGSTLCYAGVTVDPRQVRRELGVRYVLHGSVRYVASRLRILTELSDAESGTLLRVNQYEGEKADLFELQDRISAQVVSAIAPQVRSEELRRALRKHPDNMSSYDFLLQALDHLHRFDHDSFARAGGLLRQAISHDPGYAATRSYAAWWHILRISQGWSGDPRTDGAEAARHSAAAVNLDQNDYLALAIRGHCLAWMRDYQASKEGLDRAVAVGPNSALAWTMRGLTVGLLGDAEEAVRCGERAQRLSPLDPFAFFHQALLAQAYYISGRLEEAISLGLRVIARCEPFTSNLRLLTVALMTAGRVDEARDMAARLLAADPGFRLSAFVEHTVLPDPIRSDYITRLREAGLPE